MPKFIKVPFDNDRGNGQPFGRRTCASHAATSGAYYRTFRADASMSYFFQTDMLRLQRRVGQPLTIRVQGFTNIVG